MTLEQLTVFFAWSTGINIAFLVIATVFIVGFRHWVAGIHGRMFGVDEPGMSVLYVQYLSFYKVAIIVFALVPYLVLRLVL